MHKINADLNSWDIISYLSDWEKSAALLLVRQWGTLKSTNYYGWNLLIISKIKYEFILQPGSLTCKNLSEKHWQKYEMVYAQRSSSQHYLQV